MASKSLDVSAPHLAVLKTIPSLYEDDRLSDLTLKLGARTWKVHKLVLCPQSSFFDKACSGEWKESFENIITLHDDDPVAIETMLEYMYTGREPCSGISNGGLSILSLFTTADKYNLLELTRLAAERFTLCSVLGWKTAGFLEAIRVLYEDVPENIHSVAMRGDVIRACIKHEHQLTHAPHRAGFTAVVRDVTMFGLEYRKASLCAQHVESLAAMTRETERLEKQLRMATLEEAKKLQEIRESHAAILAVGCMKEGDEFGLMQEAYKAAREWEDLTDARCIRAYRTPPSVRSHEESWLLTFIVVATTLGWVLYLCWPCW